VDVGVDGRPGPVTGPGTEGHPLAGDHGQEAGAEGPEVQGGEGDGQPSQLAATEPSDDGGVDQAVDRFGRQRSKGGDGQPEDPSVERGHEPPSAASMAAAAASTALA